MKQLPEIDLSDIVISDDDDDLETKIRCLVEIAHRLGASDKKNEDAICATDVSTFLYSCYKNRTKPSKTDASEQHQRRQKVANVKKDEAVKQQTVNTKTRKSLLLKALEKRNR